MQFVFPFPTAEIFERLEHPIKKSERKKGYSQHTYGVSAPALSIVYFQTSAPAGIQSLIALDVMEGCEILYTQPASDIAIFCATTGNISIKPDDGETTVLQGGEYAFLEGGRDYSLSLEKGTYEIAIFEYEPTYFSKVCQFTEKEAPWNYRYLHEIDDIVPIYNSPLSSDMNLIIKTLEGLKLKTSLENAWLNDLACRFLTQVLFDQEKKRDFKDDEDDDDEDSELHKVS